MPSVEVKSRNNTYAHGLKTSMHVRLADNHRTAEVDLGEKEAYMGLNGKGHATGLRSWGNVNAVDLIPEVSVLSCRSRKVGRFRRSRTASMPLEVSGTTSLYVTTHTDDSFYLFYNKTYSRLLETSMACPRPIRIRFRQLKHSTADF